jgi:cytochrome oxidase assembly protein ShyY1
MQHQKAPQQALSMKQFSALTVLAVFFATMSLGVWYVFRKRGRIYI